MSLKLADFNIMQIPGFPQKIDSGIRFFFYVMAFWLPYSPAVVEVCVAAALVLWLVKSIYLNLTGKRSTDIAQLWAGAALPTRAIFWFIAAGFFSALASAFWERSFHGLFSKTLEWFVVYFLARDVFRERKTLFVLLTVFLFTAFATAVDGLLQYYWLGKDIFFGHALPSSPRRATGPFEHANDLGAFLAVSFCLALGCCWQRAAAKGKVILVGAILAVLGWGLFLTFSRGAWLALAAGMVFFFIFGQNRKARTIVLLGGIIVAGGLFSYVNFSARHLQSPRLSVEGMAATSGWRWNLWLSTLDMIKDRLWLGHGPNTFMPVFQEYRRAVSGNPADRWEPTYAHNSFLQLAAETGVIGLGCFLWILAAVFRQGGRVIRGDQEDHVARMIWRAGLAAVVVFLAHSFVDTNLYSLQLSLLFWLMLGAVNSQDKLLSNPGNCGIK